MNNTEDCSALLSQHASLESKLTEQQCELPDSHEHGHEHGHSHGGCSGADGPYSVGLHVAAIFIVLVVSFLGTLIPLAGKYVPVLRVHPFAFVIGKCAATGVVLAVAMIHMINHSAHTFQEECVPASFQESYDAYAFLFAMIAAVLMHALEVNLDLMFAGSSAPPSPAEPVEKQNITGGEERVSICGDEGGCSGHHSRSILLVAEGGAQRIASALFMEFGVTLHSVFIGLTVGITSDDDIKPLLVALSFHQLFEGLALGSRLADAPLRGWLELLLALVFSVSAPLGTAIGLGAVVGSKVSVTGTAFVLVQAIFDAVCGGILLYLAFVLMLNDFPADLRKYAGADAEYRGLKRFAMFFALWAGVGVMAGIGKWL
ncbi:cation transporter [Trypanosoma theileri]|uniref:Cation transporter n=1 Tax=Trypanosoma theileri TaxID=67003 RepID=A0A1X0NR51_9TRYP|nr:cation transporter [Trypanosoma theileri]ORC87081.1 cation transporter [Trypanosoma theileri]